MENLLEQLLQRWEQAFDELETLPRYKAQVKTTQYADSWRYDLKNFDWDAFPSDGPMAKDKDDLDTDAPHEYGFNAEGFPCYTTFGHRYNHISWEGFNTYSDNIVEYVEFCLNTGLPSTLTRLEFREGRKISYQQITINGRGSGYSLSKMSKKEVINKIRNDDYSLIATVTRYDYSPAGRIEKAFSIHISPGIGKYTSHDEYTYNNNQNLDTIRTFFEPGSNRTVFKEGSNRLTYCNVPEGMDPASLIESLAGILARSVSETLANQGLEQPIALLELSYHYADNYIPLLAWHTIQDVEDKLSDGEFDFISDYHDAPQMETHPFERLFAQLEQMMNERDDMDLGRVMLRKAASLLTSNKLFGLVKVSNDFAAYAIDWSIEGHSNEEREEIFLECGLAADVLATWKQKGMLPA